MAETTSTQESGINQVVGKVFILYGKVKAIAPDGTVRVLAVNSPVFAMDRIVTESDGSVAIVFDGFPPAQIEIGRMSDVLIDEDIYEGAAPEQVAESTATVEEIQAMLEGEGEIELEAPAAGGPADSGGGHPVAVFDLTANEVVPDSGAETIGPDDLGTVEPYVAEGEEGMAPYVPYVANVVVTAVSTPGAEGFFEGGQITYVATVDNPPQGTPLVVSLDNGATINIPVGGTSGSVTVDAPSDDPYIDAGPVSAAIESTDGGGYDDVSFDDTPVETMIEDTIDSTTVSLSGPETVSEGASATYIVSVDNAPQTDMTVDVSYSYLSASTNDIVTNPIQVTIPANQTSAQFEVDAVEDAVFENIETFEVTISNPQGGNFENLVVGNAVVQTDIIDGKAPTVSISDGVPSPAVEGTDGTITFTVTLSNAADHPLTVNYATVNGTALAGSDYTATSGTLTFAAGETSTTVTVAVLDDAIFENPEAFTVELSDPSTGLTIADGVGEGDIIDTPDAPTVSISDGVPSPAVEGTHGTITFTVTLSNAADHPLTVSYATVNGTALAGSDYTATSGTLTFAAGETSTTVIVAVLNDAIFENPEAFTVELSDPSTGLTIDDGIGEGQIQDDDDVAPDVAENATVFLDDETATNTYADANLGGAGDYDGVNPPPADNGTLGFSYGTGGVGTVLLTGATLPGSGGFSYEVTNGGLTLTISQVQGATTVDVLEVTLTNTTEGKYSVEQLNPVFHPTPGESEENINFSVSYQVTNGDGLTADDLGTLSIDVDDDAPVAVNDGQLYSVDDDATGVTIGTVADLVGDDSYGADGAAATGALTIATGSLGGTVSIDGSNLVYTSASDVTPGSTATETFTYTIKDADGDTTTATFSVELTDEGATIGMPEDKAVDEEGLSGGNAGDSYATGDLAGEAISASGNLDIDYGSDGAGGVTFDATQSALDALNLQSDGQGVNWTRLSDNTILAGYTGTTAPTATSDSNVVFYVTLDPSGTGSYTFTLAQPLDHPTADTEDDLDLQFAFTATDSGGEGESDSFTVTVDDDAPVIGSFTDLQVYNVDGASDSDLNTGFLPGADNWGNITLTGPFLEGATYSSSTLGDGTVVLTANDGTDDIFTFSLNPNGAYTFVLLEAEAGTIETDVQFGGTNAGSPTTSYDFGPGVATPSGDNTVVNPSNTGLAGDSNSLTIGEAITFTFDNLQSGVDQVIFGVKAPQGGSFNYVFYNDGTMVGTTGSVSASANGELVIDVPGDFTAVELIVTDDGADLKITSLQTIDLITEPGQELAFSVDATDGDGDAISGLINVQIEPAEQTETQDVDTKVAMDLHDFGASTAGDTPEEDGVLYGGEDNDVLDGGTKNDILDGGPGDDTLSGGTGADTFQFTTHDHDDDPDTPETFDHDTILDYSQEDGDILDLTRITNLDHYDVRDNDGKAELVLYDNESTPNELGSVTFDNIDYDDLATGDELNSLLGMIDEDPEVSGS